MKALTFTGTESVSYVTDAPDPVIEAESDAIVAVRRAGICGSDLHQYHGREPVADGTIPGHELAGEIVSIGSAVRRFDVGDMVLSTFTIYCGDCFFCRDGLSGRCDHWQVYGYQPPPGEDDGGRGLPGAQAEFVRVPRADTTLQKIPAGVSLEAAILLGDNFMTGFFCADMGNVRRDGITVVIGCGAVGLSAIAAARYLGAETVFAIDPVESRRQRAQSLGAVAVAPEEARPILQQSALRHGGRGGADSVLEAVGLPAAQSMAFDLVRSGGVISAVGMHTSDRFSFSPADAYNRNVTYRAGRCPVRSYLDRLLGEVEAGRLVVPVEYIVTHNNVPLSDGSAAYRRFSERTDDCVKILLSPSM